MDILVLKVEELIKLLDSRKNKASDYFKNILNEILTNPKLAMEKLSSCYSITQYAEFKHEEEQLLAEIVEISKRG